MASTASGLALGTLRGFDGETTVVLTDEPGDFQPLVCVFSGPLRTPCGAIAVCTASNDVLMELDGRAASTFVQVDANDRSEPDRLVIAPPSDRRRV